MQVWSHLSLPLALPRGRTRTEPRAQFGHDGLASISIFCPLRVSQHNFTIQKTFHSNRTNNQQINHGSGTQLQHNQSCRGKLGAGSANKELRGGRWSCPFSTVCLLHFLKNLLHCATHPIANVLTITRTLFSIAQSFRQMSAGQGPFWIPNRY
jgi:hypothetical protein